MTWWWEHMWFGTAPTKVSRLNFPSVRLTSRRRSSRWIREQKKSRKLWDSKSVNEQWGGQCARKADYNPNRQQLVAFSLISCVTLSKSQRQLVGAKRCISFWRPKLMCNNWSIEKSWETFAGKPTSQQTRMVRCTRRTGDRVCAQNHMFTYIKKNWNLKTSKRQYIGFSIARFDNPVKSRGGKQYSASISL